MELFSTKGLGLATAMATGLAVPAMAETELTMYYPIAVGGALTEVVDGIVADFEAANPDISVNAIYSGNYDDTRVRALSALASGEPAQLAVMFSIDAYDLIEQDLILPFDDVATSDADKAWLGSFYPALMANGTIEGKTWGIPFQRSTIVAYYNKDMFRAAGLDPEAPPKTWDEMIAMGKALTNDGTYGLMIPSTGYPYWMFQALAIQNGKEVMSGDGLTTYFDDPAVVETLEFWQSLSAEHGIMPTGTVEWGTLRQAFLEGQTAMMWHSTGNLTAVKDSASFDFGVAELPGNVRKGSPTGGGNFYLFKDTTDEERAEVLAEMEKLQFSDFVGILRAMTGLPVTIRLLDPPLHEFLTDQASLAVDIALTQERGEAVDERKLALNRAVNRLHESNPMMGLRGVRLGVLIPDLFSMQVRALTRAALHVRSQGYDPQPEIMIPLVASQRELLYFRSSLEKEVARVLEIAGEQMEMSIGSMIETPRAAITAAKLADYSDFFSFGTNDLTQLTWAFSRDDVESSFLPRYLDLELLPFSPFESLDQDGVGLLVKIACDEVRTVNPDMKLGVCGEHGGDPRSIDFFHHVGLDYVSCSPFRVPVARLEAGRAAVSDHATTGSA